MEVILTSADGKEFRYEGRDLENLALVSVVIFETLKGFGEATADKESKKKKIEVGVGGRILSMALDYSRNHGEARSKRWERTAVEDFFLIHDNDCLIYDAALDAWDQEFLRYFDDNEKRGMLLELVKAAKILRIMGLLDLTCQAMADKLARKTREEICDAFNIKSHYKPEDMEPAEKENALMYDGKIPFDDEEERCRPESSMSLYLSRRYYLFSYLRDWIRLAQYDRQFRYHWLLEQYPDQEDHFLKQVTPSIEATKEHLYYYISLFKEYVSNECGHLLWKFSSRNYQGEIADVEIELRSKEIDMVHRAYNEKDNVDEFIDQILEELAKESQQHNGKVLSRLLLLKDDCYSEIDEALHFFRSFRLSKIRTIQEENQQDDEEVNSMELESSKDSDDDMSTEGSPLEFGKYLSRSIASLLQEWAFDGPFDRVILDWRFFSFLEKQTRQLLHQELAVKSHELLTSVVKTTLDLYNDRKGFREVLKDKLGGFYKISCEPQNNDQKLFNHARDKYVKEREEITTMVKEKVDKVVNDMLEKCDDQTPGRNEAIWFLQHSKKSHYAMIDEIQHQEELVLELCHTKYLHMEQTGQAETSNTGKGEKRKRIYSSYALGD